MKESSKKAQRAAASDRAIVGNLLDIGSLEGDSTPVKDMNGTSSSLSNGHMSRGFNNCPKCSDGGLDSSSRSHRFGSYQMSFGQHTVSSTAVSSETNRRGGVGGRVALFVCFERFFLLFGGEEAFGVQLQSRGFGVLGFLEFQGSRVYTTVFSVSRPRGLVRAGRGRQHATEHGKHSGVFFSPGGFRSGSGVQGLGFRV